MVTNAKQKYGFELKLIDIDGDPQLIERFGHKVPVLADGDREILWGVINPKLLKRFLDGAKKSRS